MATAILGGLASVTIGAAITGGFFSLGAVAAQAGLKAVEKKAEEGKRTNGAREVRTNKNPFPNTRFVPKSDRREILKEIKLAERI